MIDPIFIPVVVASIALLGTILGLTLGPYFASRLRRKEAQGEAQTMRVPSWPEAFDMIQKANTTATTALAEAAAARREAEENRRLYSILRNAHDRLRDTFRQYVDRVQAGGSNALTEQERASLYETEPIK